MVLMLVWLHAPASAEPYKSTGGEREVRDIGDLRMVLAWQQVNANKEIQPEGDVTATIEGKGDVAVSPVPDSKDMAAPSATEILPAQGELGPRARDLEETRRWLQKEYQALMEIQKEILRKQKKRLGPSARTRLDKQIEEYSKRLAEYEKKGQTYDKDLEVYNALREEEKKLRKQMRETETQLAQDYESLRVQKQEIDRMANMKLSRSDREELAEKLRVYNAGVRDYKERKEEFQKAIEDYDARIKHALEGS
jgi:tetratricopeptide (TPR) repeat protein